MKNSILLLMMLCGLALSAYGQEVDVKAQTYAIKKNSDYIYGEASGDDENVCYEIAKEKLMEKIKLFMDTQPKLASADAVLVENIQSKAKKLTYERSIQIKVVCVYVLKKDISPLYKKHIVEEPKGLEELVQLPDSVEPMERVKSVAANDTLVPQPTVVEETLVPTEEIAPLVVKDEMAPVVVREQPIRSEDVVEEKGKSEVVLSVTPSFVVDMTIYSQRENELLSAVIKLKKYSEILSYLEEEKNSRYDIRFKLVRNADVDNCFWLIFNSKQELVAVFDKLQKNNLLNVNGEGWDSYSNYPKMWLYIYE